MSEELLARAYDANGREWRLYGPPLTGPPPGGEGVDVFHMELLARWLHEVKDSGGYLMMPPYYRVEVPA